MLITQLKPKEELLEVVKGKKIFVLQCYGCAEAYLPKEEINLFLATALAGSPKELKNEVITSSDVTIIANIITDYLCNQEYTKLRIGLWQEDLGKAEKIIIFSCGVGVQVVSSILSQVSSIRYQVYPGCNTLYLNGFQGLTPLNFDCGQCNQCWLNYTGSICPITACAKSLLNGPCGGAKNGKCEIATMDCGWEKIYKKLESLGKVGTVKEIIQLRNYKKVNLG